MFDVVALGELLIDFTPAGVSSAKNILFERNPGGAPANVLVALSKLGGSGAFIGKVGNDQFGYFLKDVLNTNGINTDGLKFSNEVNTTLAFVNLDEHGDRSFSFYRKPGADIMLKEEEVDLDLIKNSKIFHFGSISMTNEPAKGSTLKAAKYAKQNGIIISYDPNWRPPLWASNKEAKEAMYLGLHYADILKISEEELVFLTGITDLDYGSNILYKKGIKLIVITLGANGCFYRFCAGTGHINTYNVNVIDTTGAGDAFMGGLLYQICRLGKELDKINKAEIEAIIDFSNAVGSFCTTKKGAIPAMPTMYQVKSCIDKVQKFK